MTSPLSQDRLSQLSAFATETFGLRFPPDRWTELGRGVASAALELGIPDLEGWTDDLLSGAPSPEHLKALANHLTISETYFFRQRETFIRLENEIIPTRHAVRLEQNRPLRIWSAGCASGEEPYSIAILFRQKFPNIRPETVSIHATDINSHVLGRANRAIYTEWSFRDTPDWLKTVYFTRKPAGRYELKPEVRRMVKFSQMNLAAPIFPAEFGDRGDFDVIICRNTLMYFSSEWQKRVLQRFAEALVVGGSLMVGPCDVTTAQANQLKLKAIGPGVYQKAAHTVEQTPALQLPMLAMTRPMWMDAIEKTIAWLPQAVVPPAEIILPLPLAEEKIAEPAIIPAADESLVATALAHAHADRGELDTALTACEQAITLNRLNPEIHYLRACILLELNRPEDAEGALRRVLYLDPQSIMAQFALANLAHRLQRPEESRHHFAVLLRLLSSGTNGESIPGGDGITHARLRELVEAHLSGHAA